MCHNISMSTHSPIRCNYSLLVEFQNKMIGICAKWRRLFSEGRLSIKLSADLADCVALINANVLGYTSFSLTKAPLVISIWLPSSIQLGCRCADKNGAKAYCDKWSEEDFNWCYLETMQNSMEKNCPGAKEKNGFYRTKDLSVCGG